MTLFDFEWREEYLIFPAVKRAVAVLAQVALWGVVAVAVLWLCGLAYVLLLSALFVPESADTGVMLFALLSWLPQWLLALLVPWLYVLALWCHHVLLAGRGLSASRWLLLMLLFFAFLHPVCCTYAFFAGKPLLVNQFLLPAVLNTALPAAFVLNWFHMAAAPMHLRLLLLLFLLTLLGQYILGGSLLLLLLPVFGWLPLRALARLAPLIVSLPPKE